MDLILIRHGQSEANVGLSTEPDCDLTPFGCDQAGQVADQLAAIDLREFSGIVSPYRRARRTAQVITDRTGVPFTVDPLIREWGAECRIDGCVYPQESRQALADRIGRFLESARDRKLVIVAHAAPLAALMQLAAGKQPDLSGEFWLGVENCKIYRTNA